MPSHVVDKVLAQPRHQAQGFHVGPERMVVLRREEGDAGIVTILPDQRECFRQQLDASEVVGLLPPVFQPEAALVILDVTRNFAASLFRNIKYFTLRKLYLCRKWMQKRLQKTIKTGITLPNFDFLA